jgi:hypothetical protein
MTPEGKIKAKINRLLKKYPTVYKYMPVPMGYGPSSLDYLLCVRGRFVGIEAKREGKEPTARQEECIRKIKEAEGKVFIARNDTDIYVIEAYLRSQYASSS